jgi:hypothetical protein
LDAGKTTEGLTSSNKIDPLQMIDDVLGLLYFSVSSLKLDEYEVILVPIKVKKIFIH